MSLAIVLAAFSVVAPTAVAPASPRTVRVEVLSLLVPQSVVLRPVDRELALPNGVRIGPGARLVVERRGRMLAARSPDGSVWRGDRLVIGAADLSVELDVRGRDQRNRRVRGRIALDSDGRAIRIVVETDFETLVASGVAAELEHVADRAALEAGAIAIRSYLVAHLGRHAAEGFDFCDTTHCLFSKGLPDATAPSSRDAVAAAESTRGLVLERDGHVVAGYFTACCGGRTATPAEIWGGEDDGDYESVACSFCKASAYYRWRRSSSARAVGAALAGVAGTRVGPDAALDVVAGPGGWVRSVVIRSNGRVATVNGDAFRMAVERRLGWNSIPSPRFTIEHTRDSVVFSGGGFGHGVGLCVAGSVERARRGAGRDELLRAYFPRARVVLLESVP